jgi:hypothetical protein
MRGHRATGHVSAVERGLGLALRGQLGWRRREERTRRRRLDVFSLGDTRRMEPKPRPSLAVLPPAQSSPASQKSGDGGLPGKKIALDLQLADLAVQIVNDLLRIPDRRRLVAARKQLARTLHQLLLPVADHRRMNPKLRRQLSQGLLCDGPGSLDSFRGGIS